MIRITSNFAINESEIKEQFIRASGPGGQNVNKVASAVQLRFDVLHSPSLPEAVRRRLVHLAGRRLTGDGILVIDARRHRSQKQNRQEALDRLKSLLQEAAQPPRTRRPTKPSQASRRRRLESKRHRARIKRSRQPVREHD